MVTLSETAAKRHNRLTLYDKRELKCMEKLFPLIIIKGLKKTSQNLIGH